MPTPEDAVAKERGMGTCWHLEHQGIQGCMRWGTAPEGGGHWGAGVEGAFLGDMEGPVEGRSCDSGMVLGSRGTVAMVSIAIMAFSYGP